MKNRVIKLKDWVGRIPHLFSKCVVVFCLVLLVRYSEWTMRILEETGGDPSPALSAILLAVIGELLALAWKSKDRKTNTDDEEAKG